MRPRLDGRGVPNSTSNLNAPINYPMTRLPNYPITRSPDYPIRGFTIIELMVVLALIVVLASLAMVQYRRTIVYSKEAVLKDDLFKMRDAIDQYYADKNQYPPTLGALASDGYLREIPKDPLTESTSTWREVPAEPDLSNPVAAPGVYDVKSGSDATALDGSKYSDW
jgi:general secretion pathway protein G